MDSLRINTVTKAMPVIQIKITHDRLFMKKRNERVWVSLLLAMDEGMNKVSMYVLGYM